MDEASQIETYKEWLRLKYQGDVVGLRRYIATLGEGEASESLLINSMSFEGEQTAGQIVLAPMVKLRAALDVLREIDPDNAPESRPSGRIVDFSQRAIET